MKRNHTHPRLPGGTIPDAESPHTVLGTTEAPLRCCSRKDAVVLPLLLGRGPQSSSARSSECGSMQKDADRARDCDPVNRADAILHEGESRVDYSGVSVSGQHCERVTNLGNFSSRIHSLARIPRLECMEVEERMNCQREQVQRNNDQENELPFSTHQRPTA